MQNIFFSIMLNLHILNSSEQSVELNVTSDITLALLSPLMLHFCFEFCTMFEMGVLCEFGETKYHSEGLFPVREAGEATLRYTPFMCWFRFRSREQSNTHTKKHTRAHSWTCTGTLTSWRKASSVCGPSEKCEVSVWALWISHAKAVRPHTHRQAHTRTYVHWMIIPLPYRTSCKGSDCCQSEQLLEPKHIYLPQEVIGQTNVMNLLFLSCWLWQYLSPPSHTHSLDTHTQCSLSLLHTETVEGKANQGHGSLVWKKAGILPRPFGFSG